MTEPTAKLAQPGAGVAPPRGPGEGLPRHSGPGTPPGKADLDVLLRAPVSRPERLERLKAYLARERATIEGAHRAGAGGGAVVHMLADLADRLVVGDARLHAGEGEAAEGEEPGRSRGWALVALGGYGRRELCPHSDVDLMVLHERAAQVEAEALARELFRDLWDLKLDLGHSIRTIPDCLELAERNLATRTALLEARLLLGDAALFAKLAERLRGRVARDRTGLAAGIVAEMRRSYAKHGSSLYMLEPNIKKSGGGLRTIHFLRWIGLVRHDTADLGVLHARGLLAAPEGRALREAQEFYWRVRNDLHFAAGRGSDTVSLYDQLRLARLFGYRDDGRSLAVEQFMRRYYIHATEVHDIVERFVARGAKKPAWRRATDRAFGRRVEEIFILTPDEITVSPSGRERLLSDPARIYALFHLAQVHGREIHHDLLDRVRAALDVQDEAGFRAPAAVRRFLEVLSTPGRIADTLSLMHRTGALGKLLPEFQAVNRLVQFNRYHKYTVDEHTLMVIRTAEALARAESLLGRTYREIRRKDLLHLAMLLHDVGKGTGADHSARGAGIAAAVARRLGYDERDAGLLVCLVREHLTMEHFAFRRDLSDEKVLLRFARIAGNPETLRMLFVLTYADIAGVGPGNWNEWKQELLTELYVRVMDELTGSREVAAPGERLASIRAELLERLGRRFSREWIEAQWQVMNERYVLVTPVETIARHLEWLSELKPGEVLVRSENQPASGTTEYTVLTFDKPGLFSKIAGVLAAKGLQILRAQVDTRKNGVVVDTFGVADSFYAGPPPPERLDEVGGAIRDVLWARLTVEELFDRHRRFRAASGPVAAAEPTQVEIDNESSDAFTVIEVFAPDKQGLLYVITNALWGLGLSIHSAKVGTRLDQVLDVFYVTDLAGQRVLEPGRIETVKRTLVERIEAYEREG